MSAYKDVESFVSFVYQFHPNVMSCRFKYFIAERGKYAQLFSSAAVSWASFRLSTIKRNKLNWQFYWWKVKLSMIEGTWSGTPLQFKITECPWFCLTTHVFQIISQCRTNKNEVKHTWTKVTFANKVLSQDVNNFNWGCRSTSRIFFFTWIIKL